jgi:hypothetical protein
MAFIFCRTGIERPLKKRAGGTFLGRGRFPERQDAALWAVDCRSAICCTFYLNGDNLCPYNPRMKFVQNSTFDNRIPHSSIPYPDVCRCQGMTFLDPQGSV